MRPHLARLLWMLSGWLYDLAEFVSPNPVAAVIRLYEDPTA